MRRWHWAALAIAVLGAAAFGVARSRQPPASAKVTFSKDVAPIVFAKCAPCHRPGEAGPFSLLTYEDVKDHASQIVVVTGSRFMPPWRPASGVAEYANDRSLNAAQIDVLKRWVEGGAAEGDLRETPPLPKFPVGWQLGTPDLVVQLAEPYALSADGKDVYRNFVIPSPIAAPALRYVKAWELRPGTRTIHHAIMNLDRLGLARQRDAKDPGPGFAGMEVGDVQNADGFYLVWTPGKIPTAPMPGAAWRLDAHTDLVLQLHLQPTGKPETVNPSIGLYFTSERPTLPRFTLRVGDPPIDIPPGEKHYVIKADYELPTDVDVLSVFPHAHLLARTIKTWAVLPDGSTRGLLRIDDWDFNWQDEYTFANPITLPKGTKIAMEFSYDNSADNFRNPTRPPKRVTTGESSTDEMGNVTFQVVPREPQGMQKLSESKYRRELAAGETARAHYNLANVLAEQGNKDEAIDHYKRAVVLSPELAPAHFNLANLLLAKGDADGAITELRAAVKLAPERVGYHVNLGNALDAKGKKDDALAEFRAATAADPKSALARNSLGLALGKKGDSAGAITEFKAAIALEPDNWLSQLAFANALRAHGDNGEAIVHYRRALELNPGANEAKDALKALAP